MTSYLALALIYFNTFESIPLRGSVDFDEDLAQFWYPSLWKHNELFHFYQIQDSFVKECISILTKIEPTRVTRSSMDFLTGKGICVSKEQFTYIRLFSF